MNGVRGISWEIPLSGGRDIMLYTKRLAVLPDAVAPDGSEVRVLLALGGGSMAHFTLAPGQVSVPTAHRTVEEIWYIVAGRGEMWRSLDGREEITDLEPGVSISLPLGTHFQFRASGDETLEAVGVTMPPWPGTGEALRVQGLWESTVSGGTG